MHSQNSPAPWNKSNCRYSMGADRDWIDGALYRGRGGSLQSTECRLENATSVITAKGGGR